MTGTAAVDASEERALRSRLTTLLEQHPAQDDLASRLALGGPPDREGDWTDLGEVEAAAVEGWLALEVECQDGRGMDAKAAAAYLVGRLSWALATWLVRLHHAGLVPRLGVPLGAWAAPRRARWQAGPQGGLVPVYDLRLDPAAFAAREGPSDPGAPRALGDALVAMMRPLIEGVQESACLPRAAQWRLVTDSLTAAFLEHGRSQGGVTGAMADAHAAIAEPSALWNWQVGFVEVTLPADPTTGRPATCEWFRARGGCCRYYTLRGGEHCATCVHLDPAVRSARLRELLQDRIAT